MLIKISSDFKKRTNAAIFAIVCFVIVYFILFLAGIALAALCVYGGINLIILKPSIITGVLGIGLAGMGLIVFYFLIKFLFSTHKEDRSNLVEISRSDEPELFALIDEIVKEADTNFPHKVYLAYDVNAFVFYDSSFWSMFLPIEKNLAVGLGLVNATTRQELKAILAHEFGHFSQRSMKVGSYVYNVNRIIFNMLSDDESFNKSISAFASVSNYFVIFVLLASKIIQGIRWILNKMYEMVNIRHMTLSREMEFHADEVAANIAGSLPLEESLLRLDIANNAYTSVINFYNRRLEKKENIRTGQLYQEHFAVMNFLAKEGEIPEKYELPFVRLEDAGMFNKSKLTIENQWASHPSDHDRIARLKALNIQKEYDARPAKSIFKNFDATEKRIGEMVFKDVDNFKDLKPLDIQTFQTQFQIDYEKVSFHPIYNKYYDIKNPNVCTNVILPETTAATFDELYDKKNVELVYIEDALKNDISLLESITNKQITIKTFDYDGVKYSHKDAASLVQKLKKEQEEISKIISHNDQQIYAYFLHLAKNKNDEEYFRNMYSKYYQFDEGFSSNMEEVIAIKQRIDILHYETDPDEIRKHLFFIVQQEETFKPKILKLTSELLLVNEIVEDERKDLEYYAKNQLTYWTNGEYVGPNIELLMQNVNLYGYYMHQMHFLIRKQLLDYQANLELNKISTAI